MRRLSAARPATSPAAPLHLPALETGCRGFEQGPGTGLSTSQFRGVSDHRGAVNSQCAAKASAMCWSGLVESRVHENNCTRSGECSVQGSVLRARLRCSSVQFNTVQQCWKQAALRHQG